VTVAAIEMIFSAASPAERFETYGPHDVGYSLCGEARRCWKTFFAEFEPLPAAPVTAR
jgi:hypothetical protein